MSGTTLNNMKNKAPRPMWPWIAGAAAAAGGYAWMRKRNVDVSHRSSGVVLPEKTRLDVTEKK